MDQKAIFIQNDFNKTTIKVNGVQIVVDHKGNCELITKETTVKITNDKIKSVSHSSYSVPEAHVVWGFHSYSPRSDIELHKNPLYSRFMNPTS